MHAHDAVSLLIFALGAFSIPLLAVRIRIPAAVGELLFGIAVGPHMLGWFHPNEFTAFLAEFGFAFLMFLVGLELEVNALARRGARGVLLAAAVSVLFFAVAFGLAALLGLPIYLALVFGAVGLGVVIVTLKELGLTKEPTGQTIILVGSMAEFLTIVMLTGFSLFYEFGLGRQLVFEMGKLGVIFVAAYLVLVVLRTLIWWWPRTFTRVVEAKDPTEIGVRAGMATMLVFVALASLMGVEAILGSFIAGALFSFVFREKEVLEAKMTSLGFGFFVPIFFIWVGTEFNLPAVWRIDVLPTLGVLLAASAATKLAASLPLLAAGMGLRQTIGAALLFSAPLTLLVVIARIGEQVGVLDSTTGAAVVLLAIVTAVLMPWIFRFIVPQRINIGN